MLYFPGYPQPQYRWLKDGIPLGEFSSERLHVIFNTRPADSGSYRCVARNDVGSIFSEKIDLTVAYMGIFLDQTERTLKVRSGEAVVLDLPHIESQPAPLITWMTDEGNIPYDIKYAKVDEGNQLVILSADSSDERAYRARALNSQTGKEEYSAYTRLRLEDAGSKHEIAPVIVIAPTDQRVSVGQQQLMLYCIANARPLYELETLWFKDGVLIENSGVDYTQSDPWNRTLGLLNVGPKHDGRYSCRVRLRTGGFPPVEAGARVSVHEKPTFVNVLKTETLGEYGATVELPCDAVAVPNPNITWYRNTLPINPETDNRFKIEEDNSLVVKTLRVEDSGMYQCWASNDAGENSIATWLKVKSEYCGFIYFFHFWCNYRCYPCTESGEVVRIVRSARVLRVRASSSDSTRRKNFRFDAGSKGTLLG